MDSKLTSALARRLAAYSATAGVTLALTPGAGAQAVYHDLEPDVTLDFSVSNREMHPLDLDDDGRDDVNVIFSQFFDSGAYRKLAMRGNAIICRYNVDLRRIVDNFASGENIGPNIGPNRFFCGSGVAAFFSTLYGNGWGSFRDRDNGHAGFSFVAGDGQTHYGWLRLGTNYVVDRATVYEYGYELTPVASIRAGERPAVLLDGTVNQTTFPPEGGTLVYSFTVTNEAAAPLSLDLWLDADGGAPFTRRLGSGTLPAGVFVTWSLNVTVPAVAPGGTYDVRFKLGDFASGRFITFERFAITKEAPAGVASGGAEPFAVAPLGGDLFASAAASTVGVVGTHALSEAVPNPSTGQAALSLQVPEPQAVRVEVLDALGRRVALLHDGSMTAGEPHRLVFDGSDLPSGVYVVRAVGERFADVRVLTLTR